MTHVSSIPVTVPALAGSALEIIMSNNTEERVQDSFGSRYLSINDIVSIDIHSICLGRDRIPSPEALRFTKVELPRDFIEDVRETEDAPRLLRPLADSPEPANLHFEVTLSEKIGCGQSGIIHAVETPRTVQGPDGKKIVIPPLACKLAPYRRNKPIAREAWFYDEMQTLQGVVIPRCFGMFQASVPYGTRILPWEKDTTIHRSFVVDDSPEMEQSYISSGRGRFVEGKENREILTRLEDTQCLTFILLERLGGLLLEREASKPVPQEMSNEVYSAYDELAQFGVNHRDANYFNLCATLSSPPAIPSIPSRLTGKTYNCRIIVIDFEQSTRGPMMPDLLNGMVSSDLHRMQLYKESGANGL